MSWRLREPGITSFKRDRKMEYRIGRSTCEVAPLKRSIYCLIDLL